MTEAEVTIRGAMQGRPDLGAIQTGRIEGWLLNGFGHLNAFPGALVVERYVEWKFSKPTDP